MDNPYPDGYNPSVFFDAPFSKVRCPWSVVAKNPEMYTLMSWYRTKEAFGQPPFNIETADAVSAQAFSMLCSEVKQRIARKQIEDAERRQKELEKQQRGRGGR